MSKLCIHTITNKPWSARECIDNYAREGVGGITRIAAIGAQGLLRLGAYLGEAQYTQAGLTVLRSLLKAPYLSEHDAHQGLLLHSIYHQPNGWDHVPDGSKIANGESSMWGDYHARELALYVQRMIGDNDYAFFHCAR